MLHEVFEAACNLANTSYMFYEITMKYEIKYVPWHLIKIILLLDKHASTVLPKKLVLVGSS